MHPRHLSKLLPLILCMLAMAGCTFGIRKETRIVYAEIQNQDMVAIRIATNKAIPVTIGQDHAERDFGGYYIISAADLKAFIQLLESQGK